MMSDITIGDFHQLRTEKKTPYLIIDVRELSEFQEFPPFPEAIHIPLNQILEKSLLLDSSKFIIIACRHGTRSLRAVHLLAQYTQIKDAKSLSGGMVEWLTTYGPF
jgi:sulfur-carrier protein adenylyltransferase/sulfurtransferase